MAAESIVLQPNRKKVHFDKNVNAQVGKQGIKQTLKNTFKSLFFNRGVQDPYVVCGTNSTSDFFSVDSDKKLATVFDYGKFEFSIRSSHSLYLEIKKPKKI